MRGRSIQVGVDRPAPHTAHGTVPDPLPGPSSPTGPANREPPGILTQGRTAYS